ncbi:MAG: hypothetical protein H8E15_07890 [Planctomycetes bacterium]|nr:hypothetical protein [Planctomycetota bacterium]
MDRLITLLSMLLLLFPSSLPAMGKVCTQLDPDQSSCCCAQKVEVDGPVWSKNCCCEVETPIPAKTPSPANLDVSSTEWEVLPPMIACSAVIARPPVKVAQAPALKDARGPPIDLQRRYGVFLC